MAHKVSAIILLTLTYLIIFSMCTSANIANENDNQGTLQLVQMIFRHGDKNPEASYPTDPYKDESFWPGGWNHIMDKGKRRLYDLGIYFRQRYSNFLGKEYTRDEIYAASSDRDRTIISGMAFLMGLFQMESLESSWNNDLKWEPIPIRTIEKAYDRFIEVTEPCPRMDEIMNDNSEFIQNFLADNKEMIDFMTNHSGVSTANLWEFATTVQILQIQAEMNLELPSWVQTVLEYKPLTGFILNWNRFQHANYPQWSSFRSGPLAQKIISIIDNSIQDEINNRSGQKMILYSGHDRTIADLLLSLNIYPPDSDQLPYYGATLIFELHQIPNGHYIQVLYKNDSSPTPYTLEIPNCGIQCSITDFKRISSNFILEDWGKECQLIG